MKLFSAREIQRLIHTARNSSYNETSKREFKSLSKKFIRQLNELLGLQADIRWNEGGVAVSGQATLHADNVYVQICGFYDDGILYRECKSRSDYTGGQNRWYTWADLVAYGVDGLAVRINLLLGHNSPAMQGFRKSLEDRTNCNECGHAMKEGDETHYPECSQINVK